MTHQRPYGGYSTDQLREMHVQSYELAEGIHRDLRELWLSGLELRDAGLISAATLTALASASEEAAAVKALIRDSQR